ncbi:MAG: sigma-70 family RNA polymerase sigma factor [Ignavibacteriales bacterium]|nr:sigma-70 family RNA polymerase sigma factor [Ignavibacteriales bacterium]
MRRAQAHDPGAVDQLIRRYQKKVYAIAYQVCGFDAEEARDSAQEALLQVFRHIDDFEGRSRFSTWVHRVAVNTCTGCKAQAPPLAAHDPAAAAGGGGRGTGKRAGKHPGAGGAAATRVPAISGAELKRDVTEALGSALGAPAHRVPAESVPGDEHPRDRRSDRDGGRHREVPPVPGHPQRAGAAARLGAARREGRRLA